MQINPTLHVEPLPPNRFLAFHEQVASATVDGHEFEITRPLAALGFGFHEKSGPTHTLDLKGVIQAALEAIVYQDKPIEEPRHGSVVMLHGPTGTAYQRFFSDGLWHADGMSPLDWTDCLTRRPQVVYVAPEVEG